jgi:hypothetical protein
MPNISISQLPAAQPLNGTELVPIVQQGITVRTTTAAVSASPSQTQTFLTVNQEPTLPNSRALSGNNGITLVDGGALSTLSVELTGTALSLQNAAGGLLCKVSGNIVPRTLLSGSSGIAITNGNGVSGNPAVALSGRVLDLQNLGGSSGLLALTAGSVTSVDLQGTANQINISNPGGPSNPTISISSNPVLPGTGGVVVPTGTTAQRPALPTPGTIRYNTDISNLEAYDSISGWSPLPSGAVTLINTGTGLTGGPITSTGTISIANTGVTAANYGSASQSVQLSINAQGQITSAANVNIQIDAGAVISGLLSVARGGTGAGTLTGYVYGNGTSSFTASTTIPNTDITGLGTMSVQNDNSVSITGGSITGTNVTLTQSVTFNNSGSGDASGAIFDGSASKTVSYNTLGAPKADGTGASGTWAIDISGNAATATSASSATNLAGGAAGSIPYQTGSGATAFLTTGSGVLVGGLTPSYSTSPSLTGTNFSSIPNAALSNSSITIGTTAISLGGIATTLAGIQTITLTQNPTGNLDAATKQYVDTLVASGIHFHEPVRVESPIALTATYNNGTAGVGATLTNAGTQAALVIDGVTVVVNDRVLIYQQVNQTHNGIYVVTNVGSVSTNWVLTRSSDADTYVINSANGLSEGSTVFVQQGTTGAGGAYTCNTSGVITFGTTNITFVQISSAQIYSAGTGLTLTGTQFSLNVPVVTSLGGTGLTSYATGDMVYYATGSALSKLAIGASSYIMTSTGSAPQWSDPTGVTVGTATNAVNVGTTATSTNANFFIPFVPASTTGNQALGVDAGLSYNPSTNAITAGISGGIF